MRQALREALLLLVMAIGVGVAYTWFTHQGFFTKVQPGPSPSNSNLEMISLATAKEHFESGNALFVDARHEYDFQQGHIRGAVNIPLKDIDVQIARLGKISKDKFLIVYCDGAECNSSIELSVKLTESGFTNVKIFFGGWQEWISAKLPDEK